ncbi:MAG: DUF2062 domain-containing protein [Granulosicoccus sp.]
MTSNWLRDNLPDTNTLRSKLHGQLCAPDDKPGVFGTWVRRTFAQPMVWHLNRRSVAGGVAVGLFVSWIPIPLQMLLAAVLAAVLRVHVPVSVVMVWFTNPLTFAPLLYAAWHSGSMILGQPVLAEPLSFSTQSILTNAGHAWPTLLTGMIFCASVSAVLGFCTTLVVWRIHAIRRWRQRRQRLLK